MNSIRNSITLIGHLGQDPEVRKSNNGNLFATLSLATNEIYKNSKGEKVKSTQWHNCVAFGKTAEIMQTILKKGKEVVLKGKLTYRQWEDKQGIKRYTPRVVVNEFTIVGSRKD